MNISVCTGGIVALFTDGIDSVAYASKTDTSAMTDGGIGYLSCTSTTRHSTDVTSPFTDSGCSNAVDCVQQTAAETTTRLFSLHSLNVAVTLAGHPYEDPTNQVATTGVQISNKIPIQHSYLAFHVIQRE